MTKEELLLKISRLNNRNTFKNYNQFIKEVLIKRMSDSIYKKAFVLANDDINLCDVFIYNDTVIGYDEILDSIFKIDDDLISFVAVSYNSEKISDHVDIITVSFLSNIKGNDEFVKHEFLFYHLKSLLNSKMTNENNIGDIYANTKNIESQFIEKISMNVLSEEEQIVYILKEMKRLSMWYNEENFFNILISLFSSKNFKAQSIQYHLTNTFKQFDMSFQDIGLLSVSFNNSIFAKQIKNFNKQQELILEFIQPIISACLNNSEYKASWSKKHHMWIEEI